MRCTCTCTTCTSGTAYYKSTTMTLTKNSDSKISFSVSYIKLAYVGHYFTILGFTPDIGIYVGKYTTLLLQVKDYTKTKIVNRSVKTYRRERECCRLTFQSS